MTVRYIDYPEDGIHKIEVHSFIKTLSTGEYILSCFDKNKGVYQCIGLIKDHNNYIVDPNMEDVTKKALTEEHTNLDPEQLPNIIKCSIERIQKSEFINFIVIINHKTKIS